MRDNCRAHGALEIVGAVLADRIDGGPGGGSDHRQGPDGRTEGAVEQRTVPRGGGRFG
ncbi:hypothetical protein [Nocardia carnea]|uniref:hypothetical protein n=1 Tax=Nocardia carnea TaxID=37328 RepID=UPI002457B046|nr:hypothetical protein [Nocardia carnea]